MPFIMSSSAGCEEELSAIEGICSALSLLMNSWQEERLEIKSQTYNSTHSTQLKVEITNVDGS